MQQLINCPRCKGTMRARLGEYVCEGCGMILAPPGEDPPAGGLPGLPPASAPGPARAAPQLTPPPAAVEAEALTPFHFERTEFYDPVAIDLHPKKVKRPGLEVEKNIWFGINVLHGALAVFLPYLYSSNLVGMGMVGAGDDLLYRGIFCSIALVAVWFALFEREAAWKWSCGGVVLLMWVLITYSYFSSQQLTMAIEDNFPVLGSVMGMISGLLLIRLLWDAWFISILLRDIRDINAKGL